MGASEGGFALLWFVMVRKGLSHLAIYCPVYIPTVTFRRYVSISESRAFRK